MILKFNLRLTVIRLDLFYELFAFARYESFLVQD